MEELSARDLAVADTGRSGSGVVVVESGRDFQLHFRERALPDRARLFVSVFAARSESERACCNCDRCPGWLRSVVCVSQAEVDLTKQYLTEHAAEPGLVELDWSQFREGSWAAHWNKHTNAAAQADRDLLNRLPRTEEPWNGKGFWANRGGYQTLNFIPSLATMIFGLMAGLVLMSDRDDGARLRWMFRAGLICFGLAMAADTTLWPTQWLPIGLQQQLYDYSWSLCPAVKRIWSPTWAVFAAGWTFWTLGFFYWLVEVVGCRRIMTPFAIVGLNSIAMYCMAQLFKGWIGESLRTVARTVDQIGGWTDGLSWWLNADVFAYAPVLDYSLRLLAMWCVCCWMYRRSLYIRI